MSTPAAGDGLASTAPKKRRNPWLWIAALLALVCIGLLVWALSVKSDNDDAQAQLDTTQQKLSSTQQELDRAEQAAESTPAPTPEQDDGNGGAVLAAGGLVAAKSVYDDLAKELGATQEDLDTVEHDLQDANDKAAQAEKEAKAAKQKAGQADTEKDKAKAEADQAKADVDAAQSKATVAADCAKAYVGALGTLFEGDSVRDQATAVRQKLKGITAECKTALAGA